MEEKNPEWIHQLEELEWTVADYVLPPNTKYVETIFKNLFPNSNNSYYCTLISKQDYLVLKSHESLSVERFEQDLSNIVIR